MLKKFSKLVIGLFIIIIGIYFLWFYPRYSVPILTYHSFDYGKGLLSVAPENFERQMHYLKDKHYNVISLEEFVNGMKAGRIFAHNTVVITIDDGYENNYTCAYPVLKKYGFPAIIFLITNNIGNNTCYLNWNEINEMSRDNIFLAGIQKPTFICHR
jgi:hypothetical protein